MLLLAQMLLLINTEAIFNACWPVQRSSQMLLLADLQTCYFCLPTNILFVTDLQTCYLLLTYKHVICCWHVVHVILADLQTCYSCLPTNMLFVADLHVQTSYLLLTYKHVALFLLLSYIDVICCWPTHMLFVAVYKNVVCCWPTHMLFVADLQTWYLLLTYTDVLYILWSNLGILQDRLEHRDQQVIRKGFLQRTRCKRLCMVVSTVFSSFLFIFQV